MHSFHYDVHTSTWFIGLSKLVQPMDGEKQGNLRSLYRMLWAHTWTLEVGDLDKLYPCNYYTLLGYNMKLYIRLLYIRFICDITAVRDPQMTQTVSDSKLAQDRSFDSCMHFVGFSVQDPFVAFSKQTLHKLHQWINGNPSNHSPSSNKNCWSFVLPLVIISLQVRASCQATNWGQRGTSGLAAQCSGQKETSLD